MIDCTYNMSVSTPKQDMINNKHRVERGKWHGEQNGMKLEIGSTEVSYCQQSCFPAITMRRIIGKHEWNIIKYDHEMGLR